MAATHTTPLASILDRPGRRSRSETLLRELINTSYPHALLGNISIAFAQQAGSKEEELTTMAHAFKDGELGYGIMDFIRCVEIKRLGGAITLIIKSLRLDLDQRKIDDDRRHHEFLASAKVELAPADLLLPNPEPLARMILDAFYQIQVKYRQKEPRLEACTWICRTKTDTLPVDESLNYRATIGLLTASLRRNKFHFILTPNTVLVLDQKKRLWGLNAKPKPLD